MQNFNGSTDIAVHRVLIPESRLADAPLSLCMPTPQGVALGYKILDPYRVKKEECIARRAYIFVTPGRARGYEPTTEIRRIYLHCNRR
jgi:hypothetical protein